MSIELKNVTKCFGNKQIITDLSYSFKDHGIYSLVGESGAGKTTLLRIIAGLDNDYSGEVDMGGKAVSFAFQEYRLFPTLTALENVAFANSSKKNGAVFEKAKKLLTKLGFDESDFNLLPSELSGGMKQRVSVARALLSDAPILLLDEPTKELDGANANLIRSMISNAAKSKLVIISTHNELDMELSLLDVIKI